MRVCRNSAYKIPELKCLDLEELWNSNLQDCTPKSIVQWYRLRSSSDLQPVRTRYPNCTIGRGGWVLFEGLLGNNRLIFVSQENQQLVFLAYLCDFPFFYYQSSYNSLFHFNIFCSFSKVGGKTEGIHFF